MLNLPFLGLPLSGISNGDFGSFLTVLFFIALTFVGINFSRKFSSANDQFISSNPTTISNPIVFNVTAVFIFLFGISYLFGLILNFNLEYFFGSLIDLIVGIIFTCLLLTFASVYFSPEKMNLRVDENSSVAEDFIAFLSFGLKLGVHFSKLISRILVIVAVLYLFKGSIDVIAAADQWEAYDAIRSVMAAGGLFLLGILTPVLIYITFLFGYPIFNYLLAILHIPKISK